jgi:hypothetical protein
MRLLIGFYLQLQDEVCRQELLVAPYQSLYACIKTAASSFNFTD